MIPLLDPTPTAPNFKSIPRKHSTMSSSDKQLLEKFTKIFKVAKVVKRAEVMKSLGLTKEQLFEKLIEWGEILPFKIEDDKIIVEDTLSFAAMLDQQFADWENKEQKQLGKKEGISSPPATFTPPIPVSSVPEPKVTRQLTRGLAPAPQGKYRVIPVEKDIPIKTLILQLGLTFKPGRGFYEFTKPENISEGKQILLMKKETGEIYEGDIAREIAGLPTNADGKLNPASLPFYRVFVQSKSSNRNLLKGSTLIYNTYSETS